MGTYSALVLKRQAISIHGADKNSLYWINFKPTYHTLSEQH